VATHIKRKPIASGRWVGTNALCEAIQATPSYLTVSRKTGIFKRGIHYSTLPGSNRLLWNLDLIVDLIANSDDPDAHQRAIEAFLASLPSSQSPKKLA
jgi:hypothetical protein